MAFFLLLVVVTAVVGLCFLGTGLGLWLGRRKTIRGCACEFDPERARRDRAACGSCAGPRPDGDPPPPDAPPPGDPR